MLFYNLPQSLSRRYCTTSFPCKTFEMLITADVSKTLKDAHGELTFIFDVLSESLIGFV